MAQLDRATDFGSVGWGFESLRARQLYFDFCRVNKNRLAFFRYSVNLHNISDLMKENGYFFIDKHAKFINIHCVLKRAGIAQLVEHDLAKVGVAGSSPVSRSIFLCKPNNRRHSQVAKAQVCKTLIPGSNPGAASI